MFANGFKFGLGVLAAVSFLVFMDRITYPIWNWGRDSTDTADARSGMDLLTDSFTGCQYLSRLGSLTPRLNAEGKQVCEPRP